MHLLENYYASSKHSCLGLILQGAVQVAFHLIPWARSHKFDLIADNIF